MRRNSLGLYLHLVWATWDRAPLITPALVRPLYRALASLAEQQGCTLIALNGMPDHVHLLLGLPTTISIADLVQRLKGTSAHFVNEQLHPAPPVRWQGSYGAYTVSRRDVTRLAEYVKRQPEHHAAGTLVAAHEATGDDVPAGAPAGSV